MSGDSARAQPVRRWAGVGVLAVAAFTFVTTETLPVGLLPQISGDLHVSVASAGLLVTGYAGVVVLMAVPLTAVTARLPRRGLLLGVLGVLVVSAAGAAASRSYLLLLAARVVAALAHAVFWSVVAPLAARLVPTGAGAGPGAAGRATALVFAGNSLAVVVGVPAGTVLGQHAGWRAAFGAVAVVGLLLLAAAAALLPALPPVGANDPSSLAVLARQRVIRAAVLTTALVVVAHFTAYTYFVPLLTGLGGFPTGAAGPLLVLFGSAGVVVNLTAGPRIGARPAAAVRIVAATLALVLAGLAVAGDHRAGVLVGVAVWGAASAAMAVALQTLILQVAGSAAELTSAAYVAAFNAGIGGGALVGGQILDHLGPRPVLLTGAALAVSALPLVRRCLDTDIDTAES